MKKTITCLVAFVLVTAILCAKEEKDSLPIILNNGMNFTHPVEGALHWPSNTVSIGNGIAKLNLSKDFNSKTDNGAAYGIKALVAGAILAKTNVLTITKKFLLLA